jgi:hypothetical protein
VFGRAAWDSWAASMEEGAAECAEKSAGNSSFKGSSSWGVSTEAESTGVAISSVGETGDSESTVGRDSTAVGGTWGTCSPEGTSAALGGIRGELETASDGSTSGLETVELNVMPKLKSGSAESWDATTSEGVETRVDWEKAAAKSSTAGFAVWMEFVSETTAGVGSATWGWWWSGSEAIFEAESGRVAMSGVSREDPTETDGVDSNAPKSAVKSVDGAVVAGVEDAEKSTTGVVTVGTLEGTLISSICWFESLVGAGELKSATKAGSVVSVVLQEQKCEIR